MFVALGITFANESGDPNQAGVGIRGAIFTLIFYGAGTYLCVTSGHCELEDSEAKARGANLGNHCRDRRAANPPPRTVLGVYGLWSFLGPQVRNYSWA